MALLTFNFESQYLNNNHEISVILPDKPREVEPAAFYGSGKKYKVLWLLHGTFGDHSDWIRKSNIELYACEKDLIVVMPSGLNANYANWERFSIGYNMYDYFLKELMPLIYGWFPASDKREDNFIAGLSMGGMGALKIAMRRPENYAAICCLSAGHTNYRFHEPREGTPRFNRYLVAYGEAGPLPSEEETLARARALAEAGGPCPRVWHACGEQDSLKSNAALTRDFFESLPGNPFQYEYHEYPGRHNWDFWEARVPEMLDFVLRGRKERRT